MAAEYLELDYVFALLQETWLLQPDNELDIYRHWIPVITRSIASRGLIEYCTCDKSNKITFIGGESYCEKCRMRIK